MTDPELKGIALQALNMAKHDIEVSNFSFLMASYYTGEGIHRLRTIEQTIIERLGEDWLNHGRAKDRAFAIIRLACATHPPEAFVFVTACNMFRSTKALTRRSMEEQKALLDRGHDHHHQMVREGLLTVRDALMALAQTPERACICNQILTDRGRFEGAPEVKFFDQAEFDGRTKFFGEPR